MTRAFSPTLCISYACAVDVESSNTFSWVSETMFVQFHEWRSLAKSEWARRCVATQHCIKKYFGHSFGPSSTSTFRIFHTLIFLLLALIWFRSAIQVSIIRLSAYGSREGLSGLYHPRKGQFGKCKTIITFKNLLKLKKCHSSRFGLIRFSKKTIKPSWEVDAMQN